MAITPRTLTLLPTKITVNQGGMKMIDNVQNKTLTAPLALAYRKTGGVDKRVRIVIYRLDIMGDPSVDMYYVDSNKKVREPIAQGDIPALQNWGRSSSLGEWWVKEYQAGNLAFNEGGTYTLNRYSFQILDTAELDKLSVSILTVDSLVQSDSFKY